MISIPIVTDRLVIRRFEPSDLTGYLEFMLDEDSTKYLAFEAEQKTEAGATGLFNYVVDAYDADEPMHAYAIADRSTNKYVGSCGFAPYEADVVECYYCVNPGFRGRGFAVEATHALVNKLTSLVEVRAYCHPENHAAHAVARQCGMHHQGTAVHRASGLAGEVFVAPRP